MSHLRGTARATARLLAVCAVLAGLFLMHGLASQGCPSGAGMATTTTVATHADHSMGFSPAPADRHLPAAMSPVHAMAAGHGELCNSTPPLQPSTLLTLLLALVALTATAATLGGSRWITQVGRRPPPLTGSALLTTLCVSRT